MTVQDVRDRLDAIRLLAQDDERAHILRDELFREVLAAIAAGGINWGTMRAIAAEALKADDIEFSRWMA